MQNDAGDSKIRRIFLGLCRLIRRRKKTSTSTWDGQDTEIEFEPPFLSFCGIKRRRKANSTIWDTTTDDPAAVPEYLECLLADYHLALTAKGAASTNNIVSARPRVDAILQQNKKRLLGSSAADTGILPSG
ncbi:hypothetical protein BJX76DRAFT_358842 [Aspergillus varians]